MVLHEALSGASDSQKPDILLAAHHRTLTVGCIEKTTTLIRAHAWALMIDAKVFGSGEGC